MPEQADRLGVDALEYQKALEAEEIVKDKNREYKKKVSKQEYRDEVPPKQRQRELEEHTEVVKHLRDPLFHILRLRLTDVPLSMLGHIYLDLEREKGFGLDESSLMEAVKKKMLRELRECCENGKPFKL
jgi:hypothetical protein